MDNTKKCLVCGKNAVFYSTYLKQDLCKKHFERMLIRRVRSNMLSNGIRGYSLRLGNENPSGLIFLRFLFKEEDTGKTMILKSDTLEDFSISVMKFFLFHENPKSKISESGRFSPLFNVSEKEIEAFFDLKKKKVSAKNRDERDSKVLNFIYSIEERRPGGMISIVKIGLELGII